ncbi:hypothetical protein BN1195_02497 [Chryseobacterium oranimense G311]|uniref:hypothetical protein n=1 Tax=Chryseobacterium oranimense TaxID=421058 RepID=UPI000533B88A|nr:hypothetical protein [Chryseobacterium oranimense]CEJ70192.1 hypothetical protein BN1195_02497 [Chryseobacterium oranimense G311]
MGRAAIKDHENLLKVFVILLDYRIIKKDLVTAWADSILTREDESEYVFIELSTSTNVHETIQILNRNSTNAYTEIASRAILGILHHMLEDEKVTLKTVFQVATHLSYEERLTSDEQFLLYHYDEYIELNLNESYETLRLFKTNFLDFLSIYKDFRLDNDDSWPAINEKIKGDLEIKLQPIKKKYPY